MHPLQHLTKLPLTGSTQEKIKALSAHILTSKVFDVTERGGHCHEITFTTFHFIKSYVSKKIMDSMRHCEGVVWFAPHNKFSHHAWIELNDGLIVYDTVSDIFIEKSAYYEYGKIKKVQKYTWLEAMQTSMKHGTYGPWADEVYFGGAPATEEHRASISQMLERLSKPFEHKNTVDWVDEAYGRRLARQAADQLGALSWQLPRSGKMAEKRFSTLENMDPRRFIAYEKIRLYNGATGFQVWLFDREPHYPHRVCIRPYIFNEDGAFTALTENEGNKKFDAASDILIEDHVIVRLFQRLRTNDLQEVLHELKPILLHTEATEREWSVKTEHGTLHCTRGPGSLELMGALQSLAIEQFRSQGLIKPGQQVQSIELDMKKQLEIPEFKKTVDDMLYGPDSYLPDFNVRVKTYIDDKPV